jgi:hypothetical protein
MKIENVRYEIDWAKFRKGYSFFIPCIDVLEARDVIERVTDRLRIKIITQVVVEDGIKGLRVWRV